MKLKALNTADGHELLELLEGMIFSLDPRKLKLMAKDPGYSIDLFLAIRRKAKTLVERINNGEQ